MTVLREESATHTVPFSQKGAEHSEHAEPYAEPKYMYPIERGKHE